MVDEKKSRVQDAALTAFMRYGYRRVTMGDIAKEAGMSRPALYLVFPSKEEIFKAVVESFTETALTEIQTEIEKVESTAERLRLVFDIWTVRPYELIQEAPDAKEITECSYGFARDVVEAGYQRLESVLAAILAPSAPALARHDLTPPTVARVAAMSARGFKEAAQDSEELRALVSGFISMILATADIK